MKPEVTIKEKEPVYISIEESLAIPRRMTWPVSFNALAEIFKDPIHKREFFNYLRRVDNETKSLSTKVKDPKVLPQALSEQLTSMFQVPSNYSVEIAGDSALEMPNGGFAMVAIKGNKILLSEAIFQLTSPLYEKALAEILIGVALPRQAIQDQPKNPLFQLTKLLSKKLFKRKVDLFWSKDGSHKTSLSTENRASILIYLCSKRNFARNAWKASKLIHIPTFEQMLLGSGIVDPQESRIHSTKRSKDIELKDSLAAAYSEVVKTDLYGGVNSDKDVSSRIAIAVRTATYTFAFEGLHNPWEVAEAALWSEVVAPTDTISPRASELIKTLHILEQENFEAAPHLSYNEGNHDLERQMGRFMQRVQFLSEQSKKNDPKSAFTSADLIALYFSHHTSKLAVVGSNLPPDELKKLELRTNRLVLPLMHRLKCNLSDELGYVSLYAVSPKTVSYLKKTVQHWCAGFSKDARDKILNQIINTTQTLLDPKSVFSGREKRYFSLFQKEEEIKASIRSIFLSKGYDSKHAESTIQALIEKRAQLVGRPSEEVKRYIFSFISDSLGLKITEDMLKIEVDENKQDPLVKAKIEARSIVKALAAFVRNTDTLGFKDITDDPKKAQEEFISLQKKAIKQGLMQLMLDGKFYKVRSIEPLSFPEQTRVPSDGWIIARYEYELEEVLASENRFLEIEVHFMTSLVANTEKRGLGPVPKNKPWWQMKQERVEYQVQGLNPDLFEKYCGILPLGQDPQMSNNFAENTIRLTEHFDRFGKFIAIELDDKSLVHINLGKSNTYLDLLNCRDVRFNLPKIETSSIRPTALRLRDSVPSGSCHSINELQALMAAKRASLNVQDDSPIAQAIRFRRNYYSGVSTSEEKSKFIEGLFDAECFGPFAKMWSNDPHAVHDDLSAEFKVWFLNYYIPTSNYSEELMFFAVNQGFLNPDEIMASAERFFVVSKARVIEENLIVSVDVNASSGPKGYNLRLYEIRDEVTSELIKKGILKSAPYMLKSNNKYPAFGHTFNFEVNPDIGNVAYFAREFARRVSLECIPLKADNRLESLALVDLTLSVPDNEKTLLEILTIADDCELSVQNQDSMTDDEVDSAPATIRLSVRALLTDRFSPTLDQQLTREYVSGFCTKLKVFAKDRGWDQFDILEMN